MNHLNYINSVSTLITAVVFFTAHFPPSGMAVKKIVMLINLQYYLVMKSTIGLLLWIVCNGILSDRIREALGNKSITMILV